MKTTTPLAGALLLLILPACLTTRPLVRPDGTPDGQAIFEQRCNQCHKLPDPRRHSDEQWARLVRRYGPRAGVSAEWRSAVIAWLREANDAPVR